MTQPIAVPADGSLRVAFVAALAEPRFPQLEELTALTTVDLSCYLTGEGFQPTLEEQTVADDRLCSRATFEQPGRWSKQLSISYVFNPASPNDNKAKSTLTYLTVGFVVARWAVPYEQDWDNGDEMDVYPIKCGKQMKNQPAANTVLTITQKLFITGEVYDDCVVGGS